MEKHEIPKGYNLVKAGETIRKGDRVFISNVWELARGSCGLIVDDPNYPFEYGSVCRPILKIGKKRKVKR